MSEKQYEPPKAKAPPDAPDSSRPSKQRGTISDKYRAVMLFVVSSIGLLGGFAFLTERPPNQNIPVAIMMLVVAPLGFALGVWLWRRK